MNVLEQARKSEMMACHGAVIAPYQSLLAMSKNVKAVRKEDVGQNSWSVKCLFVTSKQMFINSL